MATRLDRRIVAAELDELPHEWDTRYEPIGGVLFMSRRPPFEHQDVIARLLINPGPPVLTDNKPSTTTRRRPRPR